MNKRLYILIFLLTFTMYSYHSAPGLTGGDSGELSAASYLLNIPHYGSSELYCIINKAILNIIHPTLNLRIIKLTNLLSSLFLALSLVIVAKILEEFHIEGYLIISFIAFISTIPYLAYIAFITEVYTLNIFLLSIFSLFWIYFLKYSQKKWLYLSLFILLLSCSIHISSIVFLPIFFVFTYRYIKHKKEIIYIILTIVIGLSPIFYLIIRSNSNVIWNFGNPDNIKALFSYFTGKEKNISKWFVSNDLNILSIKFKELSKLIFSFLRFYIIFPIISLFLNYKREWTYSLCAFSLVNIIFFITTPASPMDKFYFYLPGLFFILLCGLPSFNIIKKHFKITISLIFILFSIINFYVINDYSQQKNTIIDEWITNTFNILPKNSTLLVNGDELIFPLFYTQFVEKNRQDIKIIARGIVKAEWYKQFLKKYLNIEWNNFEANIFKAKIKNLFSEEIIPDYKFPYFFNNYGHIYKLDTKEKLNITENKKLWENIIIPININLYAPGIKRIINLYKNSLYNYSITLAKKLKFKKALFYLTLAKDIAPSPMLNNLEKIIDQNIKHYNEYLSIKGDSIKDIQKRLLISQKIENSDLFLKNWELLPWNIKKRTLTIAIEYYWQNKDWKNVLFYIKKLPEELSFSYKIRYFLSKRDINTARKIINNWIRRYEFDSQIANISIAQFFSLIRDWKTLGKFVNVLGNSIPELNLKALYYYETGKYLKAKKIWLKVLKKDPQNPAAFSGINRICGPFFNRI